MVASVGAPAQAAQQPPPPLPGIIDEGNDIIAGPTPDRSRVRSEVLMLVISPVPDLKVIF